LRPIVLTTGALACGLANRLAKHLAALLGLKLGQCQHHARNFEEFRTLHTLRVSPEDILVSFDVISVVTRVLLADVISLSNQHFDEDNLNIFRYFLTS
jgi:hypothetical protein